jgi:hypothetical protein
MQHGQHLLIRRRSGTKVHSRSANQSRIPGYSYLLRFGEDALGDTSGAVDKEEGGTEAPLVHLALRFAELLTRALDNRIPPHSPRERG